MTTTTPRIDTASPSSPPSTSSMPSMPASIDVDGIDTAPGREGLATGQLRFPSDFTWGVSAASYQIEGAAHEDGRRPSIWDTFSRVPGAVLDGDTGDVACDHYHRMPEDVALMADFHADSYRFSVSWARVCPDGGPVNPAGVGFYDRLVDELLERGVTPWLTLYHWDLPQTLEDAGGWTNRDTASRFVDYALATYDVLGDRVPTWTTLNEPWCAAFLGYTSGAHAPGRQEEAAGLVATHHLLLAHGLGVRALRAAGAPTLGITTNHTVADPADPDDPADVDAARRVDGLQNRLFLDPLLAGRYPDDILADTAHLRWQGRPWSEVVRDDDLASISAPIDVLGLNYYQGDLVTGHPGPDPAPRVRTAPRPVRKPLLTAEHVREVERGLPRTGLAWEVQPEGLYRLLRRIHDDYPAAPPLWITENGLAFDDHVGADGSVDDPHRIVFTDGHLRAIHRAMTEGVDVRGIFHWSLLDNFEWAFGYSQRFGLVHVDYETQVRTPKASLHWLARVAETGILPAADSLPSPGWTT